MAEALTDTKLPRLRWLEDNWPESRLRASVRNCLIHHEIGHEALLEFIENNLPDLDRILWQEFAAASENRRTQ